MITTYNQSENAASGLCIKQSGIHYEMATTEDLKRFVGQSALSAIDSIDIHFRSYREWQSIGFNIDAVHVHIPGI